MLDAVVTQKPEKGKLLTVRMKLNIYTEFSAVAALRGASLSSLVHQYAVKLIREERERDPAEFARQVMLAQRALTERTTIIANASPTLDHTGPDSVVMKRGTGRRPSRDTGHTEARQQDIDAAIEHLEPERKPTKPK